jgi:hypothetical protein
MITASFYFLLVLHCRQIESADTPQALQRAAVSLGEAANNGDVEVQKIAIHALGELGRHAASAVPALVALLQGWETRDSANALDQDILVTLRQIGPPAKPAAEHLVAMLDDRYRGELSQLALRQIGPSDNALKLLRDKLMSGSNDMQQNAASVLGSYGAIAIPTLIDKLEQDADCVGAWRGLVEIGPSALPQLIRCLTNTSNGQLKITVLHTIATIADREVYLRSWKSGDIEEIDVANVQAVRDGLQLFDNLGNSPDPEIHRYAAAARVSVRRLLAITR